MRTGRIGRADMVNRRAASSRLSACIQSAYGRLPAVVILVINVFEDIG